MLEQDFQHHCIFVKGRVVCPCTPEDYFQHLHTVPAFQVFNLLSLICSSKSEPGVSYLVACSDRPVNSV